MKKLLFMLLIAYGGYQYFTWDPVLDALMESQTPTTANKHAGLQVVDTQGGPDFDVNDLAVNGLYTVVEFYSETCPACTRIKQRYTKFLPLRPDVAVRRVRLANNWSIEGVKKRYGVHVKGTPHFIIFNKDKQVLLADDGEDRPAYSLINDWMIAVLKEDYKRRREEWEQKREKMQQRST